MEILYVVSEAYPYAKCGGLGEIAGSFPAALAKTGQTVRVMLPLYEQIGKEYRDRMEFIGDYSFRLGLARIWCGLYSLQEQGVTWYFVENEHAFGREEIYGYKDDDARFALFSKAVCEAVPYLGWVPDVIHCNDWQTALVPIYLRDFHMNNPEKKRIRTVFTIHNAEFQGVFSYHTLTRVFGLSGILFATGILELGGDVNLMKGAIELSDVVTTVSPTYARELTGAEASGDLAQVIASHRVIGIRNGLSDRISPVVDPWIIRAYDRNSLENKSENKLALQQRHGLGVTDKAPMMGCVGRLLRRKGFSLLSDVLPEFLDRGCQLVVTGEGDWEIAAQLLQLSLAYPAQVSLCPYAEEQEAAIYAGADFLLMPSLEEPCGTVQMRAMRYGTVPIVRATGGLRDTVAPYDETHPEGVGFVFLDYTPEAFREAISRAMEMYADKSAFRALQQRCMDQDSSWDQPVREYLELYRG